MKRMKLLALTVAALMLLSACNAVNVTEAATIGDTVVYKPEFMYYLQIAKSQTMQEAQNKGQVISTDSDWETVMLEDKTAAQYAKDQALKSLKTVMTMEAKGRAEGFEMSDEDKDSIKTTKEQIISQLGGRYSYEQALKEMGISTADLDVIVQRSVYANAYMSKYTSDNAAEIEPSEEEIQAKYMEDYVYVRHILISNQPPAEEPTETELPEDTDAEAEPTEDGEHPDEEEPTEEAEPAEEKTEETATEAAEEEAPAEDIDYDAAAKEKINEILDKLAAGEDFVKLMNEYSEDGRDADGNLNSQGYLMTDNGQMDAAFEEAAMKLNVGEYTKEAVESAYGYHIIMRVETPTEGEDYESAVANIKSSLTSDKLEAKIDEWADELGFKMNQKFFDRIKIKMEG